MESGPKTSAQLFSDILKLQNKGSLPPVDDWNPPLCENVQMKISRDGKWYFMDSPIGREKMVSLFSTVLRFDEDGNYYLVTPVEKIKIEVEDKPFVIVTYQKEIKNDKEVFLFKTNVGDIILLDTLDKLRVEIDENTQEPSPYLKVRKNLEGLISRNVFYQLVDESYERDKNCLLKVTIRNYRLENWTDYIFG